MDAAQTWRAVSSYGLECTAPCAYLSAATRRSVLMGMAARQSRQQRSSGSRWAGTVW